MLWNESFAFLLCNSPFLFFLLLRWLVYFCLDYALSQLRQACDNEIDDQQIDQRIAACMQYEFYFSYQLIEIDGAKVCDVINVKQFVCDKYFEATTTIEAPAAAAYTENHRLGK